MSLAKQAVSVPFSQGIDAKTDPVIVDAAKLLGLENYSHNKRGTLARRDAWTALAGATLTGLDTQAELFAHGRELCAIDSSGTLKTYSPGAASCMPSRGAVPVCSVRRDSILRTGGYQDYLDSASSGGLTCFVWRAAAAGASTGIYCSVIDEATGAIVVDNLAIEVAATVYRPRVCVSGGHFVFVWSDTGGPTLRGASMLVGATTLAYPATFLYNLQAAKQFDVCATPGISGALIAFSTGTATHSVTALMISPALAVIMAEVRLIASATLAQGAQSSIALVPFDVTGASNSFLAVVGDTGAAKAWTVTFSCSAATASGVSSATAATTGDRPATVTAVATSTSSATVFSSSMGRAGGTVPGPFPLSVFTVSTANSQSAVTAALNAIDTAAASFGPYLASKAFAYDGAAYVAVVTGSPLQPTLFVIDSSGAVVARALDGVNAGSPLAFVPSVTVSSDGRVFSIPATEKGVLVLYGGDNLTQSGISRVRLAMGRTYSTSDQQFTPLWHAEAGDEAYLSGGFLAAYDGAQVAEAGFHWFPEGVTAAQSASGSNPNGTYQVCAVLEWVDGRGRRHQSAPSLPVSVTTTTKGIDMTCPTLQLGVRKASATIAFYRTLASGTTFYRDSPVTTPIANSLTAATVSYTSDLTDAALSANEILYSPTDDNTAGAELFHDAPPACRAIWAHQGRLFIAGLEDEHEFRYSQLPVARQGLSFSNMLSGRIPEGHGGIIAGGVLDDKVVFYTPTRKFVMVGEGPNSAGGQGSYSTPQLIPGDVGCVDQRGLALVPDVNTPGVGARSGGLLFQSRHGLYLTDRALGDQYAGYPVEPYSLGGVVTSAVTLEDQAQLRLTLSTGEVLAYDYLYGQWSSFTNRANIAPESACIWNGLYTPADSSSGQVLQEATDTYRDLSRSVIVGRIVTAWFRTGAIDGFQRVWRFFLQALYRGDSRVEVVIHGNYDATTVVDAFTIPSTATAFGDVERQVEMRFLNAAQKCTAMRFTITDTPIASPWSGAEFSGITLEVGVKPGTSKRAPMQANSLPAPTGQVDMSKPGNSGLVEVI